MASTTISVALVARTVVWVVVVGAELVTSPVSYPVTCPMATLSDLWTSAAVAVELVEVPVSRSSIF